jgi:hypothetical protein
LNADLFRVNLINDPGCVCGWVIEDAIHFFLECCLYVKARLITQIVRLLGIGLLQAQVFHGWGSFYFEFVPWNPLKYQHRNVLWSPVYSITLKKIKIENDHSQNITPQQPNLQHVQGSPMPMGYEQLRVIGI